MAQGPLLRNLVEAVVAGAWTQLTVLRSQAEIELTSQALVDVLAVISGFYAITRIADSTGIPLDEPTRESTAEMRVHAGIDAFQYEVKNQRYR